MGTREKFEARRWAAMAIAAVGAVLCIRWMVELPSPSALHRDFLPAFVRLSFVAQTQYPAAGLAGIWIVAIAALTANAFGLFLAIKARGNETTLRLALSLACGGLSVAYFYLLVPYPVAGQPASAWPLVALFAGDSAALALWSLSMWHLARVWRIFPQPISQADWERHIAAFLDRSRAHARKGWRRWVYPQKLFDAEFLEKMGEKEGLAKLIWYGGSAKQRARSHGVVDSPWVVVVCGAVAIASAAMLFGLRVKLAGLPAYIHAPGFLTGAGLMAPSFFIFCIGAAGAAIGFSYLDYHRRFGSDEDRRRIAWVYSTVFVAGVLFLAVFLGGFGFFILGVLFALEAVGSNLTALIMLPFVLCLPLFGLACIVSLVLSVVYRGDIDPRHAARKITVWGLLGIVVAFLFVLLERAVAIKVVQWMSLPPEWGPLVAGVLVAATVAPIRGTTEKAVTRLVARYLPADFIASGERRTSAIVLCDLSGYTALSDIDQQKALLHAALLQQKAARIVTARRGRVVKSMGDAVLLEFADASDACAALDDLHAQVPAAAIQIGLDPLPLHSGAHCGEIVVGPDGDVYGQTVNLAARLQGQALDSQIVVSDAFAKAAGLAAPRLVPLGPRTLKNVQQPVDCHLVVLTPHPGEPNQAAQQPEAIPK